MGAAPRERAYGGASRRHSRRRTALGSGDDSFHFHDLRHTGNTFASRSGATLRELMNRMGHSTTRAALIYQHTAMERDRAVADALGKLAEEALGKQDPDGSGT
ncbi:tyrosine-type recombinase/integrase [Microbispora sp. NPDC088329]|uniref:tyrosine-type recombinase/integrase n=1 Tax=Microbispora sp. NPDC088329 TaxID=3154869 RepID=UPI003435FE33